jgi:hypothetical protein
MFIHVIQRQYFDVLAQPYDITLNPFGVAASWTDEGIASQHSFSPLESKRLPFSKPARNQFLVFSPAPPSVVRVHVASKFSNFASHALYFHSRVVMPLLICSHPVKTLSKESNPA